MASETIVSQREIFDTGRTTQLASSYAKMDAARFTSHDEIILMTCRVNEKKARRETGTPSNSSKPVWLSYQIALTRADNREIFRDAVFLCINPLPALRMTSGCATLSAS